MWGSTAFFLSSVWTLFLAASHVHRVAATGTPVLAAAIPTQSFFPQGFVFDWNPPGTALPIPITQQCQTLAITWERGSSAVGPNPISPYFLEIYTSIYTVPIVIPVGNGPSYNYQVPFPPGTQYQICMWDSTGVAGGCQDIYTVIPNSSATGQNPVTCPNVTLPATPLQVDAAVISGAFAQYGWIPQCTDIQVQPKNGTGPYKFTVAPTLHPPLNLTTDGSHPLNYTVAFTHGLSFFISLTDSQGNSWSQGPLHSGDNSDTACLNVNGSPDGQSSPSSSSSSSKTLPAAIGAGIGGLIVGLVAGAFGLFLLKRRRSSRGNKERRMEDLIRDSHASSGSPQSPREISGTGGAINMASGGGLEYLVEPFAMPPSTSSSDPSVPLLPGGHVPRPSVTSPTTATPADAASTSGLSDPADQSASGRRQNVYVVHHDGGRAPVTVYTQEGADVVELPPRYPEGSSTTSPPASEASRETNRRREPGSVPRKSPRI